MKHRLVRPLLALALTIGAAHAGPVQDFEAALRGSYATYRTALFATNTGDAAKSAKAMAAFADSWGGLSATYSKTPPPQYETDAQWGATLTAVQDMIEKAKTEVAAGDLAKAHEALEGVRGQIGALHERKDIAGFSGRMNACHAEMEKVLGLDLAATDAATLAGHAALLDYLATEIVRLPAAEAAGNADYAKLQDAMVSSVTSFKAAVMSGDAVAVKAAVGGLKMPYSKFFVGFG